MAAGGAAEPIIRDLEEFGVDPGPGRRAVVGVAIVDFQYCHDIVGILDGVVFNDTEPARGDAHHLFARTAGGAARTVDEAADQRKIVDIVELVASPIRRIVLVEIQECADAAVHRGLDLLPMIPHWAH